MAFIDDYDQKVKIVDSDGLLLPAPQLDDKKQVKSLAWHTNESLLVTATTNGQVHKISSSSWTPGIYFVHTVQGGATNTKKLVIH